MVSSSLSSKDVGEGHIASLLTICQKIHRTSDAFHSPVDETLYDPASRSRLRPVHPKGFRKGLKIRLPHAFQREKQAILGMISGLPAAISRRSAG